MNILKFFVSFSVLYAIGAAAASPMATVLKPKAAVVLPESARDGFLQCDMAQALPKTSFAALGVKFLATEPAFGMHKLNRPARWPGVNANLVTIDVAKDRANGRAARAIIITFNRPLAEVLPDLRKYTSIKPGIENEVEGRWFEIRDEDLGVEVSRSLSCVRYVK